MLPERGTLKDNLRPALLVIRDDALARVSSPRKYRLWRYEQLAELYGTVEDWTHDGCVRRAIYGSESRKWLRSDFMLWWKADETHHIGLLFTADPRTGLEWERARTADITHAAGLNLDDAAGDAIRLQPTFRSHFSLIQKGARRLIDGGAKLKELGDAELLRRIGVGSNGNGNGAA